MEEQSDVEPRNQDHMGHKREPAEDEWKSWQRGQVRNTLHLVSAAAQWILLLACLIYLGIDSLQTSTPQSDIVQWTHIRYTGKSVKGVAMNLTAELGSIQIRNGSIMITCDGLYLVSLKGCIFFSDLEEEDLLKLTLQKTGKATSLALWEQPFQDRDTPVNLTTVLYLFHEDNITLLTNSDATIKDLSFSLLLLTPFTCSL
ncbi:tumor necrosis factor ligand superfamily member 4 [Falco biarmicus]|uniref:tumor necrosis factor ligand superfamily member 4 n=1 Tax=Falco peregrinus TaxID=8954 RepID=UPI000678FC8E|nr:tumor necrosis factor ligand superfamily member 4 [Falco peregrinus]XP_014132780.1 tumor necrosis factor ligand superfamily member 4 [Falco cherrug]XP_037259374.1 tumor necrosis factor ligand superfamily member 4 [Falco rusticolus]XP_056212489.1 tumor necrosis factor ligand superfamily member 4 [Falco biarmicus]